MMTWNIEGLKRNIFNLKHFLETHNPDLVFLSEPQIFSFDLPRYMSYIGNTYCAEVNSDDKQDGELPLMSNKAHGGTMVIWKRSLDMHISVYPAQTSSFLPIIFSPPGSPVSVHICLYLPTSGQEPSFVEQITLLQLIMSEIHEKYPGCLIYLRGDSNVNMKNKTRSIIFNSFLHNLNHFNVPLFHNTYHHFVGQGLFDSNIDVILHPKSLPNYETLLAIICKFDDYMVDSHHDIILTNVALPISVEEHSEANLLKAPRIDNNRVKIVWSDDKIEDYQMEISDRLSSLRQRWLLSPTRTSVSILLDMTNIVLNDGAKSCFKFVKLNEKKPFTKPKLPREILQAQSALRIAQKHKRKQRRLEGESYIKASLDVTEARRRFKLVVRKFHHSENMKRDSNLFNILSSNPSSTFQSIKSAKSTSTCQVPYLTVKDKKYHGDRVPDGLFDSISNLKTQDREKLHSSSSFKSLSQDYTYIMKLCKQKKTLPEISLTKSTEILYKMRPNVKDFFSITAAHYINAGIEGINHFNFLLNCIIKDVNLATVDELNVIYALFLHKGHSKPKTSDRSYRTISTCPFLSKALDMYIHELYISDWNEKQAPTQYQGTGSSHELASLLVTEVIQHSKAQKLPLFLLFLDAQSAFDKVVIEYLVRNLYLAGVDGDSLVFLNHRLSNRKTYCDWNQTLMGPIYDEHGEEQGGVNSSDFYKLYNNELLESLQKSLQGVKMGRNLTISGVGQADDVMLCSNNIYMLFNLLTLTLEYCKKYSVDICADKTKLLLLSDQMEHRIIPLNPIVIDGEQINFTNEAEHVGVIRSTTGNVPNLLNRILCSKKATNAMLACGLARGHRSNPSACLRVLQLYGIPVLMSGLGSLVLNPAEVAMIHQHHKNTVQFLQKLHHGTPQAFIFFIAGCLPATATLHLRQFSLFGMICLLQDDPLCELAKDVLTTLTRRSNSWFAQIRNLCLQYNLPHPLEFLQAPKPKENFKKLVRAKIIDYWENKFRGEAAPLTSLEYFKPCYMSLTKPHAIWTTARENPYEVAKAVIQVRMLSGRYRTKLLTSNWINSQDVHCPVPYCTEVESLQHILLDCPAYAIPRTNVVKKWLSVEDPVVAQLAKHALSQPTSYLMQFILDATALPETINLMKTHRENSLGTLMNLTRTWCYSMHRERQTIIKQ